MRDFRRKMPVPGIKPAVHAVHLVVTLLQQILRSALAAIAVIAHHHDRRIKVVVAHERAQRIVGGLLLR